VLDRGAVARGSVRRRTALAKVRRVQVLGVEKLRVLEVCDGERGSVSDSANMSSGTAAHPRAWRRG
jgi:hypothetical protein